MTEVITQDVRNGQVEADATRKQGYQVRKSHGGFFTPVSNSVFTTKGQTTKALQILLILELKAGASRIAKLSHREIVVLTGYSLRSVERSLHSLRVREWISQIEHRVIQLPNPNPEKNYVQVYEGVIHHSKWEDWQKHLLLFVMSQFRGREQGFGVPTYSLNLYGRNGDVQVLVNCLVLTEGFDEPSLQTVWIRPSARGPTIQMAGRALRKFDGISAKQIVQCNQTPHPFVKTAMCRQQYLWQSGEWRSLKVNPKLNLCSVNVRRAIARTEVELPKYLKRNDSQRRRRIIRF